MDCCSGCQDFKLCDDRKHCCTYCDFFSKNGCTHGKKDKTRDRLTDYEHFKLSPSDFGDFYNAGAG